MRERTRYSGHLATANDVTKNGIVTLGDMALLFVLMYMIISR